MSLEDFQDGHHSGHLRPWNSMIFIILNPYVTLMPPVKFWLNPTHGLGDVVSRISSWPPWPPTWILERNDSSSSDSPCLPNASIQVSV